MHVAPFETCMGSAHEVRTRSFTQPFAPEMVGCLIVASWRVDPGGVRLASGECLERERMAIPRKEPAMDARASTHGRAFRD